MDTPFPNAPRPGKEFDKAAEPQITPSKHEIDAQNWEETDQEEDLDHLEHDPPRKVFDPRVVMEFTPLGTVIRQVQEELDPEARRAIRDAQAQEPTLEQEFQRDRDEERARQARERSFRVRMMEQFQQAREQDLDLDHCPPSIRKKTETMNSAIPHIIEELRSQLVPLEEQETRLRADLAELKDQKQKLESALVALGGGPAKARPAKRGKPP